MRKIVVDPDNTVYDSSDNCNAIIETSTNKLILGCTNTEISNTVTSIAMYAFDKYENFGKIVIASSVECIEQRAFYCCSNIIIEIGSNISDIHIYGFEDSTNIQLYGLPDTYLEAVALYNGIKYKYIISGATVTNNTEDVVYDGIEKTISILLQAGETTFIEDTDFEVTYSNNINAGTATVTVTGKGNYAGTVTKTFVIEEVPKPVIPEPTVKEPTIPEPIVTKPVKVTGLKQLVSYAEKYISLSWKSVADANGYEIYRATSKNGKYKLVRTVTSAKYKDKNLVAGKNYFYKVKSYKLVNGIKVYGDFSYIKKMLTKSEAPSINIKKTTKTKAKLTWKKVSGAEDYEVYMKTGKNGKYKKVTTLNDKKVVYTKSKLKKDTKYSFKVRAYRKVGNTKVYSAWSKVKTV